MLYDFLIHLVRPLLNLFNGRPQIEHTDRLPKGNYIIVAPHRTWMDPVFLAMAVYPKKFTFMAKEELFKGKFANWFLRKLGAFPVNRKNPGPSAIKTPVKMLKNSDRSTIIFPTGSRYSSEIKGGALIIAKLANVPLVPAVYQGPLRFGDLFKRRKRKINFGEPIYIDRKTRLNDENQHELERQMQMAFDRLDDELDPNYHYYMPPKPKDDDF